MRYWLAEVKRLGRMRVRVIGSITQLVRVPSWHGGSRWFESNCSHQSPNFPLSFICRHLGISSATPYNWRSKYEGLEVNEAKYLREPESKNNKIKRLLADKLLEVEAMKDVLSKK